MNIDDFLALIHSRRSVRRFKPDPIPLESQEKILEAGRWAMSGANAQPWEYVVVDDTAIKERIVAAWIEARKETFAIEQTRLAEWRHPNSFSLDTSPGFKDAPIYIVVLGDRRAYQATVLAAHYMWGEGGTDSTYLKNIGNTTMMMHLAASALGLGTQWISVSRLWGEDIKYILGIPDVLDVHTLIAVGYPYSPPKTGCRRPLTQIVHRNNYDMAKYRSGGDVIEYLRDLRQSTKSAYIRHTNDG